MKQKLTFLHAQSCISFALLFLTDSLKSPWVFFLILSPSFLIDLDMIEDFADTLPADNIRRSGRRSYNAS